MTHDCKRNGTTTLFAALNVLDGTVIGRCMQRHRHEEFIRFLNVTEAAVPKGKAIHAVVDTTPPTSIRRSRNGWNAIRAGPSTLPPHLRRGSMPSKGISPNLPSSDCNGACSARSWNSKPPSSGSSPRPTPTHAHSGGQRIPPEIIAAVKRGHHVLDSIH